MNTHKALLSVLLGTTLAVAPAAFAATPSAASASAGAAAPVGPQETAAPEAALGRVAHPLRTTGPRGGPADLRPFGRMVGDARVVGLGEATHSSHEFLTLEHRVFRYLAEEKGFRAFALEAPWSTGLRLDACPLRGEGDLKQIMDEGFQGTYRWWNNEDQAQMLPSDQVRVAPPPRSWK